MGFHRARPRDRLAGRGWVGEIRTIGAAKHALRVGRAARLRWFDRRWSMADGRHAGDTSARQTRSAGFRRLRRLSSGRMERWMGVVEVLGVVWLVGGFGCPV